MAADLDSSIENLKPWAHRGCRASEHDLLETEHLALVVWAVRVAMAAVEERRDVEAAPVHVEMYVPLLEIWGAGLPHTHLGVRPLDGAPRLVPDTLAVLLRGDEQDLQVAPVDGHRHYGAADRPPVLHDPVYRPAVDGLLEKDVDEKYYKIDVERWQYMKGAKKALRTRKDGSTYHYSEGAIPFPDILDKPGRTMLTSEGTVNRSSHLIEDPQTKRMRILTPIECERLNGFPDDWTNTGMTERQRYFTMGNALVVQLIERMGSTLINEVIN